MIFNDEIKKKGFLDYTKSEHFYKALLDDMVTFVAVLDLSGNIIFVNNTPLIVAGITLEEIKGTKFWDAAWWSHSNEARNTIKDDIEQCALGKNMIHEIQLKTANGSLIWIEYSMHPICDEQGNVAYLVPEGRDITDRKQQEELLRRSQKMDALGKLTGGIAHDYNNMLGIIRGYAELLGENIVGDSRLTKYAQNIQHAADRGSQLTRKLLAFTHQKTSEYVSCDINNQLQELRLLIEKTLTSKVTLIYELTEDLWSVELDQSDLEDCMINMCINALHAMELGGQLSIRTTNERLDANDAVQQELAAGDYVMLSIADTGCGMNKKTLEKIFDPFFTTKGDKGTGLGMSQVYGFVERTGGEIKVFSELGHGTRFIIYFPRSHKPVELSLVPSINGKRNLEGGETLLVVDDEPAIAELAYEILRARGYRVLTASNGEQALAILEKTSIDLMISDVIMPHMDGYELATIVNERYPQVRIQIVSGFEDDRHKIMRNEALRENILYKPYTSYKLLTHIRSLLGENDTNEPLAGHSILLMDDEEAMRELFRLKFETMGCNLITTSNGDEAIACYRQALDDGEAIDIVILDLVIPGQIGGREVAEKIREMDPDAKIIVTSGDPEREEMKHYADCGFNGALEKIFDTEEMKQVLEKVLI
jgi:PAS domain S-box-containing protein